MKPCFVLIISFFLAFLPHTAATVVAQSQTPIIRNLTTNLVAAAGDQIEQYAKLELTFQVDTVAQNVQWPFDPLPPPGVVPGGGVTVNALFTPDNWQTIYMQPAFYYQDYQYEIRSEQLWLYPTVGYAWKVRFAPNQVGPWQFKLSVQDAGGTSEVGPFTFTVVPSANKGFLRVSQADPRYFEFGDGSYFPAVGYNQPLSDALGDLPTLQQNGIQLIRMWLASELSIFGSAWSPWRSYNPLHNQGVPDARLMTDAQLSTQLSGQGNPVPEQIARPGSDMFLWLAYDQKVFSDGKQWNFAPCLVLGWNTPQLPVKQKTNYRVRVRYKSQGLSGPKVAAQPFGFTVKTGGWMWDETDESKRCTAPGVGELLAASYRDDDGSFVTPDPDYPDWQLLEGHFNSGERDYLGFFNLALENVTAGNVFVDHIWLEEELGNDQFGPNLIYKPGADMQNYFAQRGAYRFDQVVEAARQNNIYLKVVVLEKQDYALNAFELDGTLASQPPQDPDYPLFFGNGREDGTSESGNKSKVRWLQQAWWRYLQARWGYSPNIHSWELLNEGDPNDPAHYILADEFGKYLRTAFIPPGQSAEHPNRHLVTTSFWHSFPLQFWGNSEYSYVDYADIHAYARRDSVAPLEAIYTADDFYDTALFDQKLSMAYGALRPDGAQKPVIRGETGVVFEGGNDRFAKNDDKGVGLHNLLWAGLNPGGLIELYWTGAPTNEHIVATSGANPHDHRPLYKAYYNFVKDLPLNNGYYQDAEARSSKAELRAWGQKDLCQGTAHLWLQNVKHTWRAVADATKIAPINGTVTLNGFTPGAAYNVDWWDTYQPDPAKQVRRGEPVNADADGTLILTVTNLIDDIAVKLRPRTLAVSSAACRTVVIAESVAPTAPLTTLSAADTPVAGAGTTPTDAVASTAATNATATIASATASTAPAPTTNLMAVPAASEAPLRTPVQQALLWASAALVGLLMLLVGYLTVTGKW